MALLPAGLAGFPVKGRPMGSKRRLKVIVRRFIEAVEIEITCSEQVLDEIWDRLELVIGQAVVSTTRTDAQKVRADIDSTQAAALKIVEAIDYKASFSPREFEVRSAFFKQLAEPGNAQVVAEITKKIRDPEQYWMDGVKNPFDPEYTKLRTGAITSERTRIFLTDLSERLTLLAECCAGASKSLQDYRGVKGRPPLDWYVDFTELMIDLCERFQLSTALSRDGETQEPCGPLFRLAMSFERLLPQRYRARTPEGVFERLHVAHRAIKVKSR